MAFNKGPSRRYFLTHQHIEGMVRSNGIWQCHLDQSPFPRVHGRFPKLVSVHFTKTFIPLDLYSFTAINAQEVDHFLKGEKFLHKLPFREGVKKLAVRK